MNYDNKKLIIAFCFFMFSFIHSAGAMTLPGIDKTKIRLSILPGKTQYGDITVENPTSEPRMMRVYLEDWYYSPAADGSKEFVPPNTTPLSCASWITFNPSEFMVPAFGRQRVSYVVKMPPEAKGSYYAVLFFESGMGETTEQTVEGLGAGINLNVRIAALFYVEAEGSVKRSAEFSKLTLKKEGKSAPLLIEVDFRNTGNVDITCGGSFHIMDKPGLIYARGEFNDIYTFPGNSAKLTYSWKEPLPEGKYDIVLTLDLGKALEEAKISRGPIMVKEAEIEIGQNGEVVSMGELK